jgi:septal ring factor EnvC (AmiA/AmiB activator)
MQGNPKSLAIMSLGAALAAAGAMLVHSVYKYGQTQGRISQLEAEIARTEAAIARTEAAIGGIEDEIGRIEDEIARTEDDSGDGSNGEASVLDDETDPGYADGVGEA